MAKLNFENITYFEKRLVGTTQVVQNARISVKNDIAEVISVGVDSIVNSYEIGSQPTFYGKTNLRFVYFDGSSLQSANYNADFTSAIDGEVSDRDKLIFDVTVSEIRTETNANTATVSVLSDVCCYAYTEYKTPCLVGGDAYVKTDKAELTHSAEIVSIPFGVERELTASKNITTVLLAESNLCVTDYTNVDDVLRIGGEATVRLTYLSDGEPTTDTLSFSFERELDSQGISSDSQLRLFAHVNATKVRLNISENEDNTDFTVEMPCILRIEATQSGVMDFVTDAYGVDCDFSFDRENITSTLPCATSVCKKAVSLALPDDIKPITALNVSATVTNCSSLDGAAQVEGYVTATLLVKEENGYEGKTVELPFVKQVEADYLTAKCACKARVRVEDFSVVDGTAELCVSLYGDQSANYQILTDAREIPFDKSASPAIEICLASKGESLWNLAKNLHLAEDDLLATNPDITNPLEKDTRLVVFNKIV